MKRILYEEEQRFSSVWWIWVFLLALLFLTFVLILTDKSASEDTAVNLLLTVTLGFLPVGAIIYFSKLQFKIDEDGIHYKFFPAVLKWRIIERNTIKSFEVSEKKNLLEKLSRGYTRNSLDNSITMNISGRKLARIKLNNGRTFNIGTENPESVERALKKLVAPDTY